jgi:HEAT repeat protein
VPALLAQLGQDNWHPDQGISGRTKYIRLYENRIAFALAQIGPDVVPALLKVFREDTDTKRRRAAVLALGFLGPPAKAAVADLQAEAKRLAARGELARDEQWLSKALELALGRISDPNALPVDRLE